jgi:Ni,Fe-hydrogenase III small subunit
MEQLDGAPALIERFDLKFVASPRHADVLIVTCPVTHNMKIALEQTYATTPGPNGWLPSGIAAAA